MPERAEPIEYEWAVRWRKDAGDAVQVLPHFTEAEARAWFGHYHGSALGAVVVRRRVGTWEEA